MRRLRALCTITLLALLVVACQPATPVIESRLSVESLCGLSPGDLPGMDEPQVTRWLEAHYGQVGRSDDLGEGVIKLWAPERNGATPSAFLRQAHLFEVLQSLKTGPTFGEVVDTFGPPESAYSSWLPYERIRYSVGLDYPKLGLSLYMNALASERDLTHNGRLQILASEAIRVDLVQCYPPRATMEEVIRNGFPSDAKSVAAGLGRRQPWPGFGQWMALEP